MKNCIFSFIIILTFSSSLFSQKKAFTIQDLYKVKYVGAPVLSHSGSRIAFTVTNYDMYKGTSNSDIYTMNNDGTDTRKVIATDSNETSPLWSNDDTGIYYLIDNQLYEYNLKSEKTEKLTNLSTGISDPILSPDGKLVAFTTDIFPECGADNDCNKRLLESVKDGPLQAYIADSLLFRHWTEYRGEKETHLFVYNLETKKYTDIAHSELLSDQYKLGGSVKYAFSPDSKELCYVNNPGSNLALSTNSDLFIVPAEGGKSVDITSTNKSWDGSPVYSPDGKYIAFRMQLTPEYEGDWYRVAVYDRETNKITNLTENFDNDISAVKWGDDSESLYFTAAYQGTAPVYQLDMKTDSVKQITGNVSVFGYEISPDQNSIYYLSSSVGKPSEIYSINTGTKVYKSLTSMNKKFLEEVDVRPAGADVG